jgi:5-methylcytosine-specific restriction protein A
LQRTAKDQAFGKMQWRPEWLRQSTIPLTIVCGPPASGKSSYVARHAQPGDLVIDLDVIASRLSGQSLHGWDRGQWLVPAIRARNEMLGDICRPTRQWPRAWLIVSEAKAELRQWWADKLVPHKIVVLETPASVCIERVRKDAERKRDSNFETIARWWEAYTRRNGDVIVR